MDAHDAVRDKVNAIFQEIAVDRASAVREGGIVTEASAAICAALSTDAGLNAGEADELAFHLTDWNADAAFLVATMLVPERFTTEEIKAGVDMFLVHAPAHVIAAARIGGHSVEDSFGGENAT